MAVLIPHGRVKLMTPLLFLSTATHHLSKLASTWHLPKLVINCPVLTFGVNCIKKVKHLNQNCFCQTYIHWVLRWPRSAKQIHKVRNTFTMYETFLHFIKQISIGQNTFTNVKTNLPLRNKFTRWQTHLQTVEQIYMSWNILTSTKTNSQEADPTGRTRPPTNGNAPSDWSDSVSSQWGCSYSASGCEWFRERKWCLGGTIFKKVNNHNSHERAILCLKNVPAFLWKTPYWCNTFLFHVWPVVGLFKRPVRGTKYASSRHAIF